jgi:hypothetical protein
MYVKIKEMQARDVPVRETRGIAGNYSDNEVGKRFFAADIRT